MVEMNAPRCSNGPTRHRISSRISGIMRRYLIVIVPKFQLSHQLVVFSVFFSLREYQPHVNRIRALFSFHNYHRHWTSLQFLLNNVQRSLTSLLLRVILAHTLANIGYDAGAFIRFSLVSATQRRRQLPPAAGAGGSICR